MEDEAVCVCVFWSGGSGETGRNVFQLRQCLYKYIHWMSFELWERLESQNSTEQLLFFFPFCVNYYKNSDAS